jgi:hypothetical protein
MPLVSGGLNSTVRVRLAYLTPVSLSLDSPSPRVERGLGG